MFWSGGGDGSSVGWIDDTCGVEVPPCLVRSSCVGAAVFALGACVCAGPMVPEPPFLLAVVTVHAAISRCCAVDNVCNAHCGGGGELDRM